MRSLRRLSLMLVVSGLLVLGACTPASPDESELHVSLVDISSAPLGPNTAGPISGLPSLVAGGGTVPAGVVGGVYTNGRDLNAPATADRAAWRASMASDRFSTRMELGPFLEGALAAAEAREASLRREEVEDALRIGVGIFGGPATYTQFTRHAGFKPVQARWTAQQRSCSGPVPCTMSTTNFADPVHFGELRDRGARLFCAAREAAFRQPGTGVTMGSQAAASLNIFGERVDFLVMEPTVAVEPPQKFLDLASNDGAQAFAVPLLLGTRFTPIRGLGFGSLPELRTPTTLVVADAEVLNRANRIVPPVTPAFFASTHHSVTFGEDVVTSGWNAHVEFPPIPLFSVFVLEARLRFGLDFGQGSAAPLSTSLLAAAPPTFPPPRLGAPPLLYEPVGTSLYYDGNWKLATTTPGVAPVATQAGPVPGTLSANDPFLIKAIQDADYAVDSSAWATISSSFDIGAGIGLGPLGFHLFVTGGISGTGTITHEVRDAERASLSASRNPPLSPIAGVVVTPRMGASLTFDSYAFLEAKLLFWTWRLDIYDLHVPLVTSTSDPWPEAHRFRLGTGSQTGNVTKQPVVFSHFPGRPEFPSFPVNVDTCLADPTTPPPPPTRCGAIPGTGGAPRAELCVFAGFNVTGPPFCANIEATAALIGGTAGQRRCAADLLGFLCQPTSRQQNHLGSQVIARVVENTDAFGTTLGDIALSCSASFNSAWVQNTLGFGLCNASATLFAPGTAVTPATTGGPTPPGACL